MASALSAGAQAAIRYSIAILGRAPTETELNSFAAAYKGASATASEDAVAAAVVASTAGTSALRPGVFSATKQAQVILGNHGVTNDAVVAYVASMIDGTNADAGKLALPLGTVARVVANFFSNWTSTPSNPYNDVFMAGGTALKNASTAAEAAIVGGSGGAAPTTPTFTLTASESVDEGKSTIVTLATKNVASGETINYIISGTGIDENDVTALTGSATVGLDGKAYITVRALADKTTEGTETMTIMVGSATASIKINDLSLDQGKSITLTTAANSGPDFAGGSADDMFQGIVTDLAATTTLSAGDILDGGAGTDTLMVAVSGTILAGQTVTAFMTKNIEKVMVSNYETGASTLTLDMSGSTGVSTLGVSGSSITGDTIFSNVLAKADIELSNALGALTVNYPTAFVGTADTQKVSLSNVGQGATGTHNVAITVAGTEVFDITATGKNTLLGGITGGASTSVNTIKIGGAGS
ncbi:MAG: hypothetical protein EB116_13265, partial [Betaproteobacteria bacterium]|nr:hypothetical protein [Betaproteobacteria bacterium]